MCGLGGCTHLTGKKAENERVFIVYHGDKMRRLKLRLVRKRMWFTEKKRERERESVVRCSALPPVASRKPQSNCRPDARRLIRARVARV